MTHPFVVGEIACGNLKNRATILRLLSALPAVDVADDAEILELIDARRLFGRGLGLIDIHLLASCRIAGVALFTHDRRLAALAAELDVSFSIS